MRSAALTLTLLALGCQGAPARDAPADGAIAEPLPGRWRAIAGLPATCGLRASVGAPALPPLGWRPCASGRAGCVASVAAWGERGDPFRLRPGTFEAAYADAAGLHVTYQRDVPREAYTLRVVETVPGGVDHALYVPRGACGATLAASRHGVAAAIAVVENGAPTPYLARWTAGGPAAATLAGRAGELVQRAAVGAGLVALEVVTADGEVVTAAADAAPIAAPRVPASQRPLPIADGFVAHVTSAPPRLRRVDGRGASAPLVTPAAGHGVVGFALDRARDDQLVWLEAAPGGGVTTLWTAALPPPGQAATPRRIVALPATIGTPVANAGLVAVVESPALARVVRLTDGASWTLPREPDLGWGYPLWVDADAAWLVASELGPDEPGFPADSAIVRVPLPPR